MAVIFIVEDEEGIRTELKTLLERNGYECLAATDFQTILQQIETVKPHLVLLDINLPVYDGFYLCRELRKRSSIPVIVVTSRDSEIDELMSMNLGADDFVTKPYNTQILLARIASVLKRTYSLENAPVIHHKGLTLELAKSRAVYEGQEVDLTKNELRILQLLMQNKGNILPRSELMSELWKSEEFVDDNTLTVNVNRLRRKLEAVGLRDFLITKRGQGYLV